MRRRSHLRPFTCVYLGLTFVQMILPGLRRWGGAFHPLNAILVLGMYGWFFYRLRQKERGDRGSRACGG